MTVRAASIWSERLAGGFSCEPGSGEARALEQFWRGLFGRIPRGARLLEIGCGSAEVALWAAEAGREFVITASDAIEGAGGLHRHPAIAFVGGAEVEALPFPTAAFDLVVSNFAFEYGDPGRASLELARVVRGGGGAVLAIHHAGSGISAASRAALHMHARLADIPERVRQAARLPSRSLHRRKLLKSVLDRRPAIPIAAWSFTGVEYLELAERLQRGEVVAATEPAELDRNVALRIGVSREQSRVALDASAMQELERKLQAAGFSSRVQSLSFDFAESPDAAIVCWMVFLDRQG